MSKFPSNQNVMKGGNSLLNKFLLVIYIILKYPVKYGVLYGIFKLLIKLISQFYIFICKAIKKFISFFNKILKPGDIDLIIFKVVNIFTIFMALIDLFIGFIYAFIAFLFFIAICLLSVPFNIIFAL